MLLFVFLLDIMLIYPVVNRVQENSVLNRFVVFFLVAAIFVAFSRVWINSMFGRWEASTALLMAYFGWIVFSTLGSVAFGVQSPGSLLTYGLNSFAPLLFFGCFTAFPERRFLVNVIVGFTGVNIVLGAATFGALGLNIPGLTPFLGLLVFDPDAHRLVSLIGKSTIVGYLALFSFSWVLFFAKSNARYFMLLFFGFAVLLSFQRSMWAGLILAIVFYLFSENRMRMHKVRDIFLLCFFIPILIWLILDQLGLSAILTLIWNRINEFNIIDALAERSDQQLILNIDHIITIFIGEGYGKYSPLNKAENILNLPDAPYHMIFNETGLIGLGLFVGSLIAFLVRAIRRRNIFQAWFVFHLLIALVGSRILWYFPLNFLVIMLLAVLKDDRRDMPNRPLENNYVEYLHRNRAGVSATR